MHAARWISNAARHAPVPQVIQLLRPSAEKVNAQRRPLFNTVLRPSEQPRLTWLFAVGLVMLVHAILGYWLMQSPAATPLIPATQIVEVTLMAAPRPAPPKPVATTPPPAIPAPPARKPSPAVMGYPPTQAQAQSAKAEQTPVPSEPVTNAPDPPVSAVNFSADYLQNPAPVYPLAARRRSLEGRVLLRAQVLESGRCGDIEIRQSSGQQLLDNAALQAVKNWRFIPAMRGDTAISAWVEIPINFKLEK